MLYTPPKTEVHVRAIEKRLRRNGEKLPEKNPGIMLKEFTGVFDRPAV